MKKKFGSRSRTLLPLAVALSLVTSLFSLAPSAMAITPPTITSITPSSGSTLGGTTVIIMGSCFQAPNTILKIGGTPVTSWHIDSNTQITAVTGAGAAGTASVYFQNDCGNGMLVDGFTYVTPVTYTVTYNGTGSDSGTPPIDSNAYPSGTTVTLKSSGTLGKTGYTFSGWQDCATNNHLYENTFTILGNTILCPLWNTMPMGPHVVTFKSNYTGGPVDTTQMNSVPKNLTANTFTRPGYTFANWNTAANGSGTSYIDTNSYNFLANMTLYAQWKALYTVTYLGTGSTTGTPPTDTSSPYSSGATVIVKNQSTLLKTGYSFGGWKDLDSGILLVNSFIILTSMDLVPVWTPISTAHTVTFKSNYTGGPVDTTQIASTTTNLTVNSFTRTGYTFTSWNTDAAGGGMGIQYLDIASYSFAADMTLYAQWTAIGAHTVTFKSNYTGGPVDTTQTASTTTNLTANGFTRTGYTFNSWNTDPAGGGMGLHFLDGASYSFAADMTVYAQWTPIGAHTVTFNSNYTGGPVDTTQIASVPTNLTGNALTLTGFTFAGWNTVPKGSGTSYADSASYSFLADMTLYAQWTANAVYTITYDGNGNSGGTAPSPTTGSGSVTLATNSGVLAKTGSTFGGWNTAANGTGTSYAIGITYNLIADITLYAVWTPSGTSTTFKVTYVGNGATGGNTPVDATLYESGALVTVRPLGTLVRTGYAFAGWDNGGSVTYQPSQTFNITNNVTLTALWTAGKYAVTYDGNGNTGGTVPADSTLYSPGAVVTTLSPGSLVKSGSTFGGWTKEGSATVLAPARIFIISSNTTLTAVWSASAIYTITYSGNGDTSGTVPTSVTGSGTQTLATNSGGLVKTGYTFVGWNTYANGLGTLRPVGSTYLLNANVTMYADFVSATVSKNVPSLILKGKIVVTAPPKKIALNQIVPVHQQFVTKLPANAVGFELYENGKFAISAKSNSVFLKQIVGPKDQVTVVAVGKDGSKSAPSPVALSKDPISLANINFNTDSYQFIGIATKILDKVAAVMIQHGYTHLDIWGYVDTQGSKASWVTLSNNRAKAVNAYMAKKLKGTGIIIKNAGRAQTQAVGNNNTAAGRALNRRVEIRVS